jgi:hypothetical protein
LVRPCETRIPKKALARYKEHSRVPIPRFDVYITFTVPHPQEGRPTLSTTDLHALIQEFEERLVAGGAAVGIQLNSSSVSELPSRTHPLAGPAEPGGRSEAIPMAKEPPRGQYL